MAAWLEWPSSFDLFVFVCQGIVVIQANQDHFEYSLCPERERGWRDGINIALMR